MSNYLSIVFGLLSALSFGMGDFSGGFTTKKNNVFLVLLYSQIIGLAFLLFCIILMNEQFNSSVILFGLVSGIFGGFGLLAFYRGLSLGNMGVVAPITAVITPIIPLMYSFISLQYTWYQIVGIILALASIWLVSGFKMEKKFSLQDLRYAISAGFGFGFFLVFINLASTESSIFYPIVFARIASIIMTILILIFTRTFEIPKFRTFSIISIVGILDTVGNLFFILSSQFGRLDFASVLLSLGPVVTVLLAWKILKEKISKIQVTGILISILAVILLST